MAAATSLSKLFLAFFVIFFVILVIRIDKVDSSQSSNIVEFWLLVFSILVFLDSERLYPSLYILLAVHDLVW